MFYRLGKKFRKTLGGVATTPLPLVRPRVNTNYVQCYHGRFPIRIMAAADLQATRK